MFFQVHDQAEPITGTVKTNGRALHYLINGKLVPASKWHPSNIGVIDMTQIIDDPEPKPAWQSITYAALAVLGGLQGWKYKDLLAGNTEAIVTVVGLLVAAVGRWRAGGVSVPFVGAKKK